MSTVTGLKNSAVDDDLMIIKDSEDQYTLTNLRLSSMMMNNVSLTDHTGNVKTYTIWRDVAQSIEFGTFEVSDGSDGTGINIPDYDPLRAYDLDDCVWRDNLLYRLIIASSTGALPEDSPAAWEPIPLGGVQTVFDATEDVDQDEIRIIGGKIYSPVLPIAASAANPNPFVEGVNDGEWYNIASVGLNASRVINDTAANKVVYQGNHIYVNSVIGTVELTVDDSTNDFQVSDFNNDFTATNHVRVNLGTDTIVLDHLSSGFPYRFVRFESTFRVYGNDGTITQGDV